MANEKTVTQAPEGFRRTGTATAAGWFCMTTVGNVMSGTLTGMYLRKDTLRLDGKSKFYQVQVDKPCKVREGTGDDAKIVDAAAGSFINVNYGPKTAPWEAYVGDIRRGAVYQVWGIIKGPKVKLTGGRTMHDFDVFDKMVQAPSSTAVEPDFIDQDVGEDDDADDGR